jgi:hypothetical protein
MGSPLLPVGDIEAEDEPDEVAVIGVEAVTRNS